MSAAEIATGYRALARVIFGSPGRPRRWAPRAACTAEDPALFLERRTEWAALKTCGACAVLADCRVDALDFERALPVLRISPVGVVGGLTASERRAIHAAERRDRDLFTRSGQSPLVSLADLTTNSLARREIA